MSPERCPKYSVHKLFHEWLHADRSPRISCIECKSPHPKPEFQPPDSAFRIVRSQSGTCRHKETRSRATRRPILLPACLKRLERTVAHSVSPQAENHPF